MYKFVFCTQSGQAQFAIFAFGRKQGEIFLMKYIKIQMKIQIMIYFIQKISSCFLDNF